MASGRVQGWHGRWAARPGRQVRHGPTRQPAAAGL